jgi:hypothetical protein
MPLSVSSLIAFSFFDRCVNPMPRSTFGALAAPAIAEAWCYATLSLSKGYLDQLHAQAIIGAIEAFTSSRLSK